MRLNVRALFGVLSTLVIICLVTIWTNCSERTFNTYSTNIKPNYQVSNWLFISKVFIFFTFDTIDC